MTERYAAMEYIAGKYWRVGVYDNLADATARAKDYGYKAKVQRWSPTRLAWVNVKKESAA